MAIQKSSHTYTKIRLIALRANHIHTLIIVSFTVLINMFANGQEKGNKSKTIKPVTPDSTLIKSNITVKDSSALVNERLQDTIKTDTIIKKEGVLTDIVNHSAKGYSSYNRKENKLYLYDEAKVRYGIYEITAGVIVIDNSKNLVYAGRLKDSTGTYSQLPVFTQAGDVVTSDSIQFNTKTQKALIWNSKTEQQGGTIFPKLTKKENDSVYFIKDFKFTTSEDPENPEYYIYGRRAKVVPNKKVVTGPVNLYIADVPTPIGVPFAFFPLTRSRTSGVIFPSFGEENERGFFIQNGGYYFAINDNADLAVVGDYFTNGSYGIRAESSFIKRYKFRSNLRFSFQNFIESERGLPDFSQSSSFNLNWQHTKDPKSSPNSNFSASVNLGSNNFFRESLNQVNASSTLNNTLQSSVSYSYRFQSVPQVNLSLTASSQQNTNSTTGDGNINITFPTFVANVDRIFPFAPKTGTKKGVFQNINLTYTVNAQNTLSTTESEFRIGNIFSEGQTVARHSIPLSTNFKLFKYFSVTAGGNYNETWTLNTIRRTFNQDTEQFVNEDVRGFDTFRTYNLTASLGTTIYGQFNFGKGKKIEAIRHVIRPQINYSLNPAFDQFFDNIEVVDANGTTVGELEEQFSRFQNVGAPSNVFSSNIGFNISNTIEAKVRSNDSTATEPKKITLLNNFNISGNYNLAADSLNLSTIRVTGGTKLFNSLDVNFNATLDPYALDGNNQRINTFNIENGGGLARLTNANITARYTFSSKNFSRRRQQTEASRQESVRNGGREDDLFGVSQDFTSQQFNTASTEQNGEENQDEGSDFYNFKLPWDINVAYTINYLNTFRQNEISSQTINLSGNVQLSPLWSIGVSSGYNFQDQNVTFTQFRFERDLKSWRMNFTWVPFGPQNTWNFFIGVKSSILSDLKYDKRRERDRQL